MFAIRRMVVIAAAYWPGPTLRRDRRRARAPDRAARRFPMRRVPRPSPGATERGPGAATRDGTEGHLCASANTTAPETNNPAATAMGRRAGAAPAGTPPPRRPPVRLRRPCQRRRPRGLQRDDAEQDAGPYPQRPQCSAARAQAGEIDPEGDRQRDGEAAVVQQRLRAHRRTVVVDAAHTGRRQSRGEQPDLPPVDVRSPARQPDQVEPRGHVGGRAEGERRLPPGLDPGLAVTRTRRIHGTDTVPSADILDPAICRGAGLGFRTWHNSPWGARS